MYPQHIVGKGVSQPVPLPPIYGYPLEFFVLETDPTSSLHLDLGLPISLFLWPRNQKVAWCAHLSGGSRVMCPTQPHFMFPIVSWQSFIFGNFSFILSG